MVVIHDCFHVHTDSKKIELAYDLEEHLGTYIGFKGAILYFRKYNPKLVKSAQDSIIDFKIFSGIVNKNYNKLTECYENGEDDCEDIMDTASDDFALIMEKCNSTTPIYSCRINNAFFVRHINYTKNLGFVFETLNQLGIKDYIDNPQDINNYLITQIDTR